MSARLFDPESLYDWVEVLADEVFPGDVYANHGPVTESRPYQTSDGWRPGAEWVICCGWSFATFGTRDRRVVIGRPKETPHD